MWCELLSMTGVWRELPCRCKLTHIMLRPWRRSECGIASHQALKRGKWTVSKLESRPAPNALAAWRFGVLAASAKRPLGRLPAPKCGGHSGPKLHFALQHCLPFHVIPATLVGRLDIGLAFWW